MRSEAVLDKIARHLSVSKIVARFQKMVKGIVEYSLSVSFSLLNKTRAIEHHTKRDILESALLHFITLNYD